MIRAALATVVPSALVFQSLTLAVVLSAHYCPFCGAHSRHGGTGSRHGVYHCALCFADYQVEYLGAYPPTAQAKCDEEFVKQGGTFEEHPSKDGV